MGREAHHSLTNPAAAPGAERHSTEKVTKMISNMIGKNWKTYAVVAAMLGVVAVEKIVGIDIPGVDVSQDWMKIALEALGLGALRSAIGKA